MIELSFPIWYWLVAVVGTALLVVGSIRRSGTFVFFGWVGVVFATFAHLTYESRIGEANWELSQYNEACRADEELRAKYEPIAVYVEVDGELHVIDRETEGRIKLKGFVPRFDGTLKKQW